METPVFWPKNRFFWPKTGFFDPNLFLNYFCKNFASSKTPDISKNTKTELFQNSQKQEVRKIPSFAGPAPIFAVYDKSAIGLSCPLKHITPYIDTLTERELSKGQEICTKITELSPDATLYFLCLSLCLCSRLKANKPIKTFLRQPFGQFHQHFTGSLCATILSLITMPNCN